MVRRPLRRLEVAGLALHFAKVGMIGRDTAVDADCVADLLDRRLDIAPPEKNSAEDVVGVGSLRMGLDELAADLLRLIQPTGVEQPAGERRGAFLRHELTSAALIELGGLLDIVGGDDNFSTAIDKSHLSLLRRRDS